MTNEEVEKSIREIWALFKKTDQRFAETDRRMDQRFAETERLQRETGQQIKELGKQIGGLGRKFGGFTEGMAFPSMQRILLEQFKMEYVSPRVRIRRNGEEMELDVLAYADGEVNEVYVVEVKSRVREEKDIQDMLDALDKFPRFFPEHKDKALYGIITVVDINEQMRKKVLDAGLYLAMIRDDTFCLEVPEGFKPKRFN